MLVHLLDAERIRVVVVVLVCPQTMSTTPLVYVTDHAQITPKKIKHDAFYSF